MKITYFRRPADFRRWLEKHHETSSDLLVGYYKKDSGKPSMTWPESVDEALCFGWIDGLRRRVDDTSYTIRFTPRKPRSIWSAVNIARVEALAAEGRMQAAGVRAFQARVANKSGIYSYEQRREVLDEPYATTLRKNRAAWSFFKAQPPSYRRAAVWWVISAKREATRLLRVARLIEDSAAGRTLPAFTRK